MATIVIPAHNEATVIGRTLDALAGGLRPGTRVVVACNGCTDDTAAIARSYAGRLDVDVIDLAVDSKQAALNGADEHLAGLSSEDAWPRVYLDADITAPAASINAVLDLLDGGTVLAARPAFRYRTDGADPGVQAYYRARSRTPEVLHALWGAGIYAVGEAGRRRWGAFPLGAPDDLFVDSRFTAGEKRVLDVEPVLVEVPRTTPALYRVLKRVHRHGDVAEHSPATDAPVADGSTAGSGGTLKALLRGNSHGPAQWADAAAYVVLSVAARAGNLVDARRGRTTTWERDDTSR